ncbi:unannotated protein [freshwater metagenome]|uniref:Unannotated protein n=1 Tax=freshwater metagenome TaxID=449393 RepID=A0A6J7LJE3_9ZZZZ|nr:DUF305 domain-containing protein [Actinomycetota bacterium]
MFKFSTRTVALLGVTAATGLAVAGCGSSGTDKSTAASSTATSAASAASAVDRAFVAQMVPHHEMAIEMGALAPQRGERTKIKELGNAIAAGQAPEVKQLQQAARRLGVQVASMSTAEKASGMDHSQHGGDSMATAAMTLGLSMDDMAMSMNMDALTKADPFDRAFIDEMIPHHQGAIRMARAELAKGKDPGLRKIATAIVATQTKEIQQMNSWRKQWYGSESPAGGVPTT